MKKLGLVAIVATAFSMPALAVENVALGSVVSVQGSGFGAFSSTWGAGSLAAAQTVTDGIFLPIGQQWNLGTVFWNGTGGGDANNFVTIELGGLASIGSFKLQADNNDLYGIQYRDSLNQWQSLLTIDPHNSWGMDMGSAIQAPPITTDAFRIRSVGGDGYYSVSEFQAFGSRIPDVTAPVPEPETYAMMLAGLGLLGVMTRRRKQKAVA